MLLLLSSRAVPTVGAQIQETAAMSAQAAQMDRLAATRGETVVVHKLSSDFSTFSAPIVKRSSPA
jgi:hypothetical protein